MAIDTRERLVAGAAALFQRQGVAGTGISQIRSATGATVGSLYHFFPGGKDELAAASLRWAAAGYAATVGAVLDAAGDDPVDAVTVAFEAAAQTLLATDYADACPIATVALEVASSNEPLREVTAEIFEGWLHVLDARWRSAGIDESEVRDLSTLFLAALEGGFLLSRAAKSPDPMRALGRAVAGAFAASTAASAG